MSMIKHYIDTTIDRLDKLNPMVKECFDNYCLTTMLRVDYEAKLWVTEQYLIYCSENELNDLDVSNFITFHYETI
jgi:hypothetical protein